MLETKTKINLKAISAPGYILLAINALQTVFAIIVIGLVAEDTSSSSPNRASSANYSIVISIFTIFTAPVLGYCVLSPPSRRAWLYVLTFWQFILGILWAVAAGLLGGQGTRGRFGGTIGLAVVEMVTLIGLSISGCVGFCCARKRARQSKM